MFKRLYRSFGWFFDYYKREYLLSLLAIAVSYVLTLVPPWLVGYLADTLTSGAQTAESFRRWIILLFFVIVVIYFVDYVWGFYIYKASASISLVTRQRLMRKFLRQTAFHGFSARQGDQRRLCLRRICRLRRDGLL